MLGGMVLDVKAEEVQAFLAEARRHGYSVVGAIRPSREPDGSSSLRYVRDGWRYHDNYFGGNPFAGREVVHHADRPVFCIVYYGVAEREASSVSSWLREALAAAGPEALRGPSMYRGKGWTYRCTIDGTTGRFTGLERIERGGATVYQGRMAGGWIDLAGETG
jgi:Domain of unknown function (DUF5680)